MELNRWVDVWIGAATTASEPPHDAFRAPGKTRRGARRDALARRDAPAPRTAPDGRADPADLVLRAARTARRRSAPPDDRVDLAVHATAGGPGAGGGTAARVLRGLGCPAATAWEVRRPVDGGVLALHLAAQYVSERDGPPSTALVTALDGGPAHAEEAAGLVLTTTGGVARLLATAALGAPPHTALLRGDLTWHVPVRRRVRRGPGRPAAAGPRRPAGLPAPAPRLGAREEEAAQLVLAECGRAVEDVTHHVHARTADGDPASGGHLTSLSRLLENGGARRGETVLLVGGDVSGVCSAVLEIA